MKIEHHARNEKINMNHTGNRQLFRAVFIHDELCGIVKNQRDPAILETRPIGQEIDTDYYINKIWCLKIITNVDIIEYNTGRRVARIVNIV
jgi:hypothetical protein